LETVCPLNKCVGCMACVNICSKAAIHIEDNIKNVNAIIDTQKCVECGLCKKVCQILNPVQLTKQISFCQGWAIDQEIRQNSSSGGYAIAIEKAFIENGGYVCSCLFQNGEFTFGITNNPEELVKFAGSKYVKSNSSTIYTPIKELLIKGNKVLFVGLPCQVSGLVNFIGAKLSERLYTIDLICHGTPSVKLLQKFLLQHGVDLNSLESISFRSKKGFYLKGDTKQFSYPGTMDTYLISFLEGAIYTDNCYECHYATLERVSDVTLGDSWGSCEDKDILHNGISLALIQTLKGKELLQQAKIDCKNVDINVAIQNNEQLRHSFIEPDYRNNLLNEITKGANFDATVKKYLPKQYMKQKVKAILLRLGLMKSRGRLSEN